MENKLKTVDAETLLSTPMSKTVFIVDHLIPQGVNVISGASKIGKSWLMLWLGLQVAHGLPVWGLTTQQCDVLYLSLEDTQRRIKDRLYNLTDTAPSNLYFAVMCGLIGSQHCFIKPGSILFIEDIGEEVYKIERMLYQLRLSGVLANLKALVVGQFTEYHYDERNSRNMYDMIQSMVSDYSYPVAYNFPIGHVDMNVPIIEGAEAKLCVDSNGTSLKFT